MGKLFISHSSQDDAFVRELRAALELHGQGGWIDSRELRGGDPLWSEIKKAIESGAPSSDIHAIASQQGMVTLADAGFDRALTGETTVEEVRQKIVD